MQCFVIFHDWKWINNFSVHVGILRNDVAVWPREILLVYVLIDGLDPHYSLTRSPFFLFWQAILVVLLGPTDILSKFCKCIFKFKLLSSNNVFLLHLPIIVNAHCDNYFHPLWFPLCLHEDLHIQAKKQRKINFLPKILRVTSATVWCKPERLEAGVFLPNAHTQTLPNACKTHARNVAQCTSARTHVRRDGRAPRSAGAAKGEWHGSICRLPSGCQSLVSPVGSDKLRHKRKSH